MLPDLNLSQAVIALIPRSVAVRLDKSNHRDAALW
jgi:hypothetical protein